MQIDIAPDMLSLRSPMEVNLVDDSAQALRASPPVLDRKTERSWRGRAIHCGVPSLAGHGK